MSAAIERRANLGGADGDPYFSRIGVQPEIAARVDPVTYGGKPAGPLPLGEDQVRRYDENGYLEIDTVFAPDEIATLLAECGRLRADCGGIDPETLILEPDGHELRSVFRIHEQSTLFSRLARDARLVGIARQLLGDEVYVHQSRLNYKPGFVGKEFYWHSDFETWHVEDGMPRMRALSMSILLTPNTPYNGPLMVIPGSHRSYVRCVGATPDDHYKQSLRRQEYGVPDPESLRTLYHRGGIVAPCGAAGKLVIFDCNVMHGSNGNISPLPRSNVFVVYNSVTNRVVAPYGGKRPRPEFIAARAAIRPLEAESGSIA